MAMFYHPVQTNHLTWAFEIGWFLINFLLVASIVILDRFRARGFISTYLILMIATFCSAQAVVLWLCSLVQICLLPSFRHRAAASAAVAFGLVADMVAIAQITPAGEGLMNVRSLADLAVYTLSVFGSFFAIRDATLLPVLGAIVLAVAAAVVARALILRSSHALDRLSVLLITTSLAYVAVFIKGRYQNGLPWVLAEFHAGPLLIPMLLGFVLVGIRCWGATQFSASSRIASVSTFAFLAISIATSLPYMRERGATA